MKKSHLPLRVCAVLVSHLIVGFSLAWIIRVQLGSDPCTTLNVGVTRHLPISFGTWNLIMNAVLFLFVIVKDRSRLGLGTLSQMTVSGYATDFFGWVIDSNLSPAFFQPMLNRVLVCIPALALFVVAVALYMSVDMGVSPYDALPYIITDSQKKLSFRAVRTIFDVTVLAIGILLGGDYGIVTVIMAFSLGSVIAAVHRRVAALLQLES